MTNNSTRTELTVGQQQIVKYAKPQSEAEAKLRFKVLEDRGDRLYVECLNTGMSIHPTECFAASEYVDCDRSDPFIVAQRIPRSVTAAD